MHSSSGAALAGVQEALDQAQLELSHMHHEQEEGEQRLCKLQDKLQRATSTLQVRTMGPPHCLPAAWAVMGRRSVWH